MAFQTVGDTSNQNSAWQSRFRSKQFNMSLLTFYCFCLVTKECNCQSAQWPQLSWKESVSAECAQDRAGSDQKTNDKIERTCNTRPPNARLREQHCHSSHQVSRGSGRWREAKHSSCSGLWGGSTDAAGAPVGPTAPRHLPYPPNCSLVPTALMPAWLQSHGCQVGSMDARLRRRPSPSNRSWLHLWI